MGYFADEDVSEDKRRNIAFPLVNAIREAITMAQRSSQHIPYEKAFDILGDLDPESYKEMILLLTKKNESELLKYYKQKGEALNVNPKTLIEEDIKSNEILLGKVSDDSQIKKHVFLLKVTLKYFETRKISENQMLNRDFSLVDRGGFFGKKLYDNEVLKDYRLNDNRVLRMRLLHPDKFEHILGADLIYEQFDLKTNRVRFIHLQYKVWNTDTMYFSSGNMKDQMQKLKKNICDSGFCKGEESIEKSDNYRFPFCSAFLRPTSNMQNSDSKMVSTGHHVPICHAIKLEQKEGKLTKKNIVEINVGHRMFENLFVVNHLGSRWISIDKLEEFYLEKGIISEFENIRLHVQEVLIETDEKRISKIGI